MKILITGATGFVGNHVVNHILQCYPDIDIVATSTSETKAKGFGWYSSVTYKEFDLHSEKNSEVNYYEYFGRPDKLIHLAWEGLPNFKELYHFERNLYAQYSFLRSLIEEGLNDLTITGTCFEYGIHEGCLDETMPSDPSNSYALAKDTLRKFLNELNKKKEFYLKWVRLFYMYGSGQSPKSIIPQLERALEQGDSVFNMSGGEQVRDYLHINQIGEYIVRISLQNKITGIINCSSGIPISIKDFIISYLKERDKSIHLNLGYYPYSDYEPMKFWGNNEKLKKIIGEQNRDIRCIREAVYGKYVKDNAR